MKTYSLIERNETGVHGDHSEVHCGRVQLNGDVTDVNVTGVMKRVISSEAHWYCVSGCCLETYRFGLGCIWVYLSG